MTPSANPSSTSIISVRHVTKRFPGVVALNDVSLDIRKGELHSICGENGAGKSTLMRILAGVIGDYEGRVWVRGESIRFRGTRDAEAAGIGIIHQELNLVEELSAAANIFLGRELRGRFGFLDPRRMNRETQRLLEPLECDIDPRALAGTLRVGDQQLVEIAKALSRQTDILIMDEPTSALTETEVERLYRVIHRLRQRDVTIIYISHKMDEILHLSDRITVLRDGQRIDSLDRANANRKKITCLMVGREIAENDSFADRKPGDVILDVKNLCLRRSGRSNPWRLFDISFQLRRGEILGIAGLMGAGRTELLECLFGASSDRPTGQIILDDRRVHFKTPREALRAGVAMLTEDRKRLGLFPRMVVRENVSLCSLSNSSTGGFIRSRHERSRVNDMVRDLNIRTAGIETPISNLSGGNQQKAIVARWLLTRPKVLLLDDPTRGVDVGGKDELYQLMNQLCRDGMGIILTSSELPELLTICDRISVLSDGRLTASFSQEQATEQRIMEAATR